MAESFITFKNVSKTYQMGEVTIKAADSVDFEIHEGELALIVGSSGAGKTTVLNILGGMDSADGDGGEVWVDGKEITRLSNRKLTEYRRNQVGFVFQFYNLIPNLTALENLEIATQLSEKPLAPTDVLAQVGLADRTENFPAQLSGGEQQRVSIARALAKNPRLLLCDEPTGALDYATGKQILTMLQNTCRQTGKTIIIITHNAAIEPIADRVIRMRSGKVHQVSLNPKPKDVADIEW
ncbi:MAG: ABC transporter ATP-binding protein [Oscillospiraceae bacterium]|nr:ABC transporter ATP-binding protein [Oscillospiraceae bacterium]